ncbi:MAG: TIGR04255 family protein [Bacteroidota bacterium]
MLEDICYTKNPIKEAIIRLDFLIPIPQFNDEIPSELISIIKKLFPIPEPREVIARELQISNKGVTQNENKVKEWNFHNKERNRKLVITKDSLLLVHNDYESYVKFSSDFFTIVNPFFKIFNLQLQRFGMRYVNNIEIEKGDPFNWTQLLNKNLLCIFNIPENKQIIARAFHNLELNFGEFNVRFQYGMHNPDYPAPIKKKAFILDYDAYTSGILGKDELDSYFPEFHIAIQKLFESSITERFRTIYK